MYVHGARSFKAGPPGTSVARSSLLSNAKEKRTILVKRKTLFLSGLGALTLTLVSEAALAARNQRDMATGREKEEYRTFRIVCHTTHVSVY